MYRRTILIEAVIAALVLVSASMWGANFWKAWIARGGQPMFYQRYFEPAVMIACGRGFVAEVPEPSPPLHKFLWVERDSFSCSEISANQPTSADALYQKPWRYLLYTVGIAWRVLGISWSGMGPLFGLLFGISITLIYAIARLGMDRVLGVVVAAGVAVSTLHLQNLPHLRDYAKEPFTLALFFILGLLVSGTSGFRRVVGLSAMYGVVLGFAYGFRTDFLVNVPLLFLTLALFLEGGLLQNIKTKLAAAAACLLAFVIVGWPIISSVYREGGCQWHVVLLGLQTQFDDNLAVDRAPYDFGYAYADGYIDSTIKAFTTRTSPAHPPLKFCTHEYDTQTAQYLTQLVTRFPADFMTRALASMRMIAELPFLWWLPPMPNWVPGLYLQRQAWFWPMKLTGRWFLGAAVLLLAAGNLRLACFAVFFFLYVGGYPALQFADRHYFHLEFITWWAMGFLVYQVVAGIWRLVRGRWRLSWREPLMGFARMAAVAAGVCLLVTAPLAVLRAYQGKRAASLLSSYIAAPKTRLMQGAGSDVADAPIALPPVAANWSDFLEVDVDAQACAPSTQIAFRYDRQFPADDYTHVVKLAAVKGAKPAAGTTRIFTAVFRHATAVELADGGPHCTMTAYRIDDVRPFPLLLDATLPANWEQLPLYQRLADWHP